MLSRRVVGLGDGAHVLAGSVQWQTIDQRPPDDFTVVATGPGHGWRHDQWPTPLRPHPARRRRAGPADRLALPGLRVAKHARDAPAPAGGGDVISAVTTRYLPYRRLTVPHWFPAAATALPPLWLALSGSAGGRGGRPASAPPAATTSEPRPAAAPSAGRCRRVRLIRPAGRPPDRRLQLPNVHGLAQVLGEAVLKAVPHVLRPGVPAEGDGGGGAPGRRPRISSSPLS